MHIEFISYNIQILMYGINYDSAYRLKSVRIESFCTHSVTSKSLKREQLHCDAAQYDVNQVNNYDVRIMRLDNI